MHPWSHESSDFAKGHIWECGLSAWHEKVTMTVFESHKVSKKGFRATSPQFIRAAVFLCCKSPASERKRRGFRALKIKKDAPSLDGPNGAAEGGAFSGPGRVPDDLAAAHGGFQAARGGIEERIGQYGRAPLEQQHDRRAAVEEHALFLPPFKAAGAVQVAYFAHQHRAYLDLSRGAEMVGFEEGVLAAVLDEHVGVLKRDGAHGVQRARNEAVFALHARVEVAIAVIVVHAQAKHQRRAAREQRGPRVAAQQARGGVQAALDGKGAVLAD